MEYGLLNIFQVVLASTGGAALLTVGLWIAWGWHSQKQIQLGSQQQRPTFLFNGDDLIDATPDARLMIGTTPDGLSDRHAVLQVLSHQFPSLAAEVDTLALNDVKRIAAVGTSKVSLDIRDIDGRLRLTLQGAETGLVDPIVDAATFDAMQAELGYLRQLSDNSPQLIWQQDNNGRMLWANRAYLAFSDKLASDDGTPQKAWPGTTVFPDIHNDISPRRTMVRRLSVTLPKRKAESWFDILTVSDGGVTVHYASDANEAVRADQTKRKMVQTLSKIFAHLSVGLAIFDDKKQLTIFNPALIDLTELDIAFLSGRPTLDMFLDALREARLLPEPKNYANWREQFKAVEAAALDGTYSENWSLPDGLTYRVTGRPHPDGAFAFFFEDISAEVSLTRRFRTEIETGQSVLDIMPDALAVFSEGGTLVMSNKAYDTLWELDRTDNLQSPDIKDEVRRWQTRCSASPMWSELRNRIGQPGEKEPWMQSAVLDDGRRLLCESKPLGGGMTLVTFKPQRPTTPILRKLTMEDPSLRSLKA